MRTTIHLLVLTFAVSTLAHADVSLKNGNFFISFNDIKYTGGLEPNFERVYNSKADYLGILGYDWGVKYETKLSVEPDGTLLITEFGGGAPIKYVSKNYDVNKLKGKVDEMVQAAAKGRLISGQGGVDGYRKRLLNEPLFRTNQWQLLLKRRMIKPIVIREGEQFFTTDYQYQYVTRVKNGYVHVMTETGNIRKFDERGRLVQIADRQGNFINLSYNANGNLASLVDNFRRKMIFTFKSCKYGDRLTKIAGESGKSVEFRFDSFCQLSYSKSADGVVRTYKYTTDVYKHLNEISAVHEHRTMRVGYYGLDQDNSVRTVQNPDGTLFEYAYLKDPRNKDYYGVKVTLRDQSKKVTSISKYDYFNTQKPDGSRVTRKLVEDTDGHVRTTEYDDKFGLPVRINDEGSVTEITYDDHGRPVKRRTPTDTTTISYDSVVGQIKRYERDVVGGPKEWTEYDWDDKNRTLTAAKNSNSVGVRLFYDSRNRLKTLIDEKKDQLNFRYNDLGKPIEISDGQGGTLNFTYKDSGDVDKTNSNGGAQVIDRITSVLNTLYELVKPAGISVGI